jgi:glycosyltransferase involved in cell wall biosynthesis
MRVCIVTVASYAHGFGGMQAHVLDLGRGLVRAGHEVEVIAPRHPEGLERTEHEGIRWHFVDAPGRKPRRPNRHPLWLRLSAEAFERLHAENPFDVVHSESTSGLGLIRRGVHHRVPFAVKFHGNYLGLAQEAIRRGLTSDGMKRRVHEAKLLLWISGQHFIPPDTIYRFRACEAMVPSRQQFADTRISYLLKRSRLHVVPNGVDADVFRPRSSSDARSAIGVASGPLLLTVGRLNREKGVDLALCALARLDEAVKLVIVGDGEARGELEDLAGDLGLGERAIFAGRQSPDRIPLYLAAADVFLFPTQRDEAAPLVLPEAMACGLPVVASSIGGITEVIDRPGENGVLVRPRDVVGLVAEISALVADPARAERMGAAARERVLAEYTIDRMIERTLAVYELAAYRYRANVSGANAAQASGPGGS